MTDPRDIARAKLAALGLSDFVQVRQDGNVHEAAEGVVFVEAVISLRPEDEATVHAHQEDFDNLWSRLEQVYETIDTFAGERDAALAEVKRLKALINLDRTGLAHGLNYCRQIGRGYFWIARGEWGSYEYDERTEKTLRAEIGNCLEAIEDAAVKALRESGERAHEAINGAPLRSESEPLEWLCAAMTIAGGLACSGKTSTCWHCRLLDALHRYEEALGLETCPWGVPLYRGSHYGEEHSQPCPEHDRSQQKCHDPFGCDPYDHTDEKGPRA